MSQAIVLDGERLRAQQADLLTGVPAIRDEMSRLEAVRDVCRGVASRLRDTVQTAERGVAELKRKGDPPVDELVCSTSIVHNQYVSIYLFLARLDPETTIMIPYVLRTPHRLIDLVAEDNAIEDTIYHLHRALNAGRIDLDRFLRVRPSPMPSRARWLLTAALEFIFSLSFCAHHGQKQRRRRVYSPKSSS